MKLWPPLMRGYMWLYPGHYVNGNLASWLGVWHGVLALVLAWPLGLAFWPGLVHVVVRLHMCCCWV